MKPETPETRYFGGLDLHQLDIDEAYVNLTSTVQNQLYLFLLSDDCYKCPYQYHEQVWVSMTFLGLHLFRFVARWLREIRPFWNWRLITVGTFEFDQPIRPNSSHNSKKTRKTLQWEPFIKVQMSQFCAVLYQITIRPPHDNKLFVTFQIIDSDLNYNRCHKKRCKESPNYKNWPPEDCQLFAWWFFGFTAIII